MCTRCASARLNHKLTFCGPPLDIAAREDLVLFINACFASTGQREFYSDASGQRVSVEVLHEYILGNYRRLYARTLAAGVNHFNQGLILHNLLATGRATPEPDRAGENQLITRALGKLPLNRVYRLFHALRNRQVNNRRTRAIIRDYIGSRRDPAFDALKYRNRMRLAASHAPGAAGEVVVDNEQLAAEQFIAALAGHIQLRVAFGITGPSDERATEERVERAITTFLARYRA